MVITANVDPHRGLPKSLQFFLVGHESQWLAGGEVCHDDCTFRDGVQGSVVTPVPETESGIVARSFLDLRMRLVAQNSFRAGGQGVVPSGSTFTSRIDARNLDRHI